MTSFRHIYEIIQSLEPLEVIEICGLDESPEELAEALQDYIEDNIEDIRDRLVENCLLEESE